MYSKEFMKFLYEYQKDDCKTETPKNIKVKFEKPKYGKASKVYIEIKE